MVLVVEDNRVYRLLFEELLTDWGLQVTLAEDGFQALQALEQCPVDLVLLDVRMPGIDGIEVARRIRQREAEQGTVPVTIIAVTADRDAATREACVWGSTKSSPSRLSRNSWPGPLTAAAKGSSRWLRNRNRS
jgi:CheY-like chemotaxis protein